MSFQEKTHQKVSNLKELVARLNDGDFESVTNQLGSVALSAKQFIQYATWKADRYTRNCISHNDAYELVLLCWQPGQQTAIHCHDDKECWVKVIQGTFLEEMYTYEDDVMTPTGSRTLGTFEITNADESSFFHSLKNTTTEVAMTLHLYMKPIHKCRVYLGDNSHLKFKEVTMYYDTIAGKQVAF